MIGSTAAAVDDLLRPRHDGVPGAGHVDVHDIAEILGTDGIPRLGSRDAGVGHDDVEPAQCGHAVVDGVAKPVDIAGVDDGGHDAAAGGFDQVHGLGEVIGSGGIVRDAWRKLACDVDRDDVGALVGHPDGMCAALAARRSGDESHLAREPSAHFCSFCAARTRLDPMISRCISLVPSYRRSSRTSR